MAARSRAFYSAAREAKARFRGSEVIAAQRPAAAAALLQRGPRRRIRPQCLSSFLLLSLPRVYYVSGSAFGHEPGAIPRDNSGLCGAMHLFEARFARTPLFMISVILR